MYNEKYAIVRYWVIVKEQRTLGGWKLLLCDSQEYHDFKFSYAGKIVAVFDQNGTCVARCGT